MRKSYSEAVPHEQINYGKYEKVFLYFNNSLAMGQHAKPILIALQEFKFLNSMRFIRFVRAF